jgi:hypothetical protein
MTIEFRNAQSLRDILVPAHHPATHNLNNDAAIDPSATATLMIVCWQTRAGKDCALNPMPRVPKWILPP